jgi:hypothetical protein
MNKIDINWIAGFTGLQVKDIESFIIRDGVLHVTPSFDHGVLTFDLPLPERITSDGKSDYKDLCDTWAGDEHIVCWRERVEIETLQYNAEMHHRNLSEAGDL